jgi:hypothetical protein
VTARLLQRLLAVRLFVSTSVEQQRTFQQHMHLGHNSETSAMRLDCTSASAFNLQLCGSNIAQQQLQRFSASANGDASVAATQRHAISASTACSSFSNAQQ